jgi:hypothetical protein
VQLTVTVCDEGLAAGGTAMLPLLPLTPAFCALVQLVAWVELQLSVEALPPTYTDDGENVALAVGAAFEMARVAELPPK